MTEKERFYEERYRQILPSCHGGSKDTLEFLSVPRYSLSDYLYLRHIKKCYLAMKDPFSDENMNKMADFFVKAVMENKKMSADFLANVGDYWISEVAQKKIDQYYPELSEEFHQRTEKVLDDVSEVRHWRDARYCHTYFKRQPEKIALFTGREMNHLLRKLPLRQSRKLFFLWLNIRCREKKD